MNRSATIGSAEVVRPIPIALSGDRDNIERIPLLFGSGEDPRKRISLFVLVQRRNEPFEIERDETGQEERFEFVKLEMRGGRYA